MLGSDKVTRGGVVVLGNCLRVLLRDLRVVVVVDCVEVVVTRRELGDATALLQVNGFQWLAMNFLVGDAVSNFAAGSSALRYLVAVSMRAHPTPRLTNEHSYQSAPSSPRPLANHSFHGTDDPLSPSYLPALPNFNRNQRAIPDAT
jgi:hypothetical protein